MNNKIRIGFIYKKDYTFLNPNHFDKTTYYFFMEALRRNEEIDVIYYPSARKFDCSKLKGKVDVVLLPNNNTDGTPDELENIKNIDIPVICRTGDPHWAERKNQFQFHEKWKIDYYFNFMHRDYFYQFYPKDFKYRTITFGIEPGVFKNIDYDLRNRNKSKILNSGALGKRNFKSRLAKENKKIDVLLTYDQGLNRHYGLLDLAEKYDIIKKVSTRYELPDGAKIFGKQIMEDPEKYFTDDIMEKLEIAAQKEFQYGMSENAGSGTTNEK